MKYVLTSRWVDFKTTLQLDGCTKNLHMRACPLAWGKKNWIFFFPVAFNHGKNVLILRLDQGFGVQIHSRFRSPNSFNKISWVE
jgi:hypothetical protein